MSQTASALDLPTAAPARRPRIMQVITHLGLGGAERVAFTLMKGLLDQYDFNLFAVSGIEAGDVGEAFLNEARAMKVPVYRGTRVPIKYGGMLLAGLRLMDLVKTSDPDVIHLHTEIPESAYASAVMLRSWVGDVPLVRTIHNSVYWAHWKKLGNWTERHMRRPFIAAVSEPAKQAFLDLRARSGGKALPADPQIIFNGLAVDRAPARESTSGPIRLLFAGRFEDQKGADLLPDIIRQTKSTRPCELVLHGNGTHEPAIRALAANPPAGWTINLRPAVPNLVAQMPSFDLLLMPSRYEGLSLMAIESLLSGLPVVATSGPGLRDGFPTDYPWLAAPGDAVAYANLLSDVLARPETWPAVAEQGNRFAREHFDARVMCDAYDRLYKHAIVSRVVA